MDFKVLLSPEALSDLESIVAYIAAHDAGAADRIGQRLIYRVNTGKHCVEVVRFWHAARGFPQVPRRT